MKSSRRTWLLVTAVTVAVVTVTSTGTALPTAPYANAHPATDDYGGFYNPPAPLPDGPVGDVIRTEPFPLAVTVPGEGGPLPATAERIMYKSTDTNGSENAVTGTYMAPTLPWRGPGPRPLVAVAVGTQGQGDQCAPSKLLGEVIHYDFPFDVMAEYEAATMYALLARGMAVIATDYQGLGTPDVHGYLNRLAEGHAVLDSLRAAQHLSGSDVTADTPLAIVGYSQGGGAAASAAELQSSYAPELNIKGTYIMAPVADLLATLRTPAINGGILDDETTTSGSAVGLFGYIANGWYADYPQSRAEIDKEINSAGRQMMTETAHQCIPETGLRYMFRPSQWYTNSGKPITSVLDESPILKAIAEKQRIGTLEPQAPTFIAAGSNDDVIPHDQARQLVVDWCRQGATVGFETIDWIPPLLPSTAIGHLLPWLPALSDGIEWIEQRFADEPAPNSCGTFR